MAQLNVRLDDHTRDLFDALANARGLSASELVRELINQALGRDQSSRPRDDTTPAALSAIDRRGLSLLHEVLALLTSTDGADDEAKYHRAMVDVLSSGYTAEYYRTFQMIQPEMTERECDLVNDILEMFALLERSVGQLTDEELSTLGEHAGLVLKFRGFDFQSAQEGRLAGYARHLIDDGRWKAMAERFDSKHEYGNSHAPLLAAYQRMLSVWRPILKAKIERRSGPDSFLVSAGELREIMAAWSYPGD